MSKVTTMTSADACMICYEDFDDIEAGVVNHCSDDNGQNEEIAARGSQRMLLPCHCEFCRDCLKEYIKTCIALKDVPISCPSQTCQGIPLCDGLIQDILVRQHSHDMLRTDNVEDDANSTDDAIWQQYERLQRLSTSLPSLTAICPACNEIVTCSHEDEMDLSCPACQRSFCKIHGDAHSCISCREFTRTRQAKLLRKSERALDQWTKPCSHCGARIQKSKGCNYMICSNCRKDMCYQCGTHEYLTGTSVRRCTQCHTVLDAHCCFPNRPLCQWVANLLFLPLLLLLALLWSIFACAVAAISACGFCFYGCGIFLDDEDGQEASLPQSQHKEQTSRDAIGNWRSKFSPFRGISAVLAIIFLPFLVLLEERLESKGKSGFLEAMLPAAFRDTTADEMPVFGEKDTREEV